MEANAGSWHGVELRHLAALEAIAKEGSFSGAGTRMGYSQSAISGQIATLERLVGARLVTRLRGSRKVAITPEGQLLLDHAKVINARLSAARADLLSARDDGAPVLRIGTFQSVSQTLLPGLFRRLLQEPVPVLTSLREDADIDRLVDLLVAGELDVAFVLLPVAQPELETIQVLSDPWTVVVRHDHPLASLRRPVSAQDLSQVPIVTYERCRSQNFIEGSLAAAGAQLRVVTRLADYRSVLTLAGAGLGCGLVPRLAVEADLEASAKGRLRVLTLADQPPRLVGLAWNRDRRASEVVDRFIGFTIDAGDRAAVAT